jgi:hypothetical protein
MREEEEGEERGRDGEGVWPFLEVAEFLISEGANCLAENRNHETPFSLAARGLMSSLVEVMVTQGTPGFLFVKLSFGIKRLKFLGNFLAGCFFSSGFFANQENSATTCVTDFPF